MTFVLKSVVSYETLGLQESFNSTYFGHVIFKAWQYVIAIEIMCKNLKYVSIKAN